MTSYDYMVVEMCGITAIAASIAGAYFEFFFYEGKESDPDFEPYAWKIILTLGVILASFGYSGSDDIIKSHNKAVVAMDFLTATDWMAPLEAAIYGYDLVLVVLYLLLVHGVYVVVFPRTRERNLRPKFGVVFVLVLIVIWVVGYFNLDNQLKQPLPEDRVVALAGVEMPDEVRLYLKRQAEVRPLVQEDMIESRKFFKKTCVKVRQEEKETKSFFWPSWLLFKVLRDSCGHW